MKAMIICVAILDVVIIITLLVTLAIVEYDMPMWLKILKG